MTLTRSRGLANRSDQYADDNLIDESDPLGLCGGLMDGVR
jgi:hypothetical protein